MPTTDPSPSTAKMLSVHQRLATSGARSVHVFRVGDRLHLVVPQLAEDVPGQPPNMNGGNADVDALLYHWEGGQFVERDRLPSPSGEDALSFRSGGTTYLAFANLRTGKGPYETDVDSLIYREEDGKWIVDETLPTFGAKQWHHFSIDDREFLALAQGLTMPGLTPRGHGRSVIFERVDGRWQEFQVLGGRWGYNWAYFRVDGHHFLGYADQVSPSVVYRWDGNSFMPYQTFGERFGRSFLHFSQDGGEWLAFACINGDSTLYHWNGELFEPHQSLGGPGGREFELFRHGDDLFLVRVCFIQGKPPVAKTDLMSQLYRWDHGKFEVVEEFPTFGGTDASFFEADGRSFLVVANSLTPDVRFRQDSIVYEVSFDHA
ncbi:hypothetical protein KIPE111705_40395 [Kibdelosporangium persicum]|uniref:EPTP domain-containing protein n=1 Tax=Kibdelosporangium persicum TaxID=2698649 RepID=A0ABX2FJ13_9PSEU|nr:hypothetical protein [Kibdelosporangium persicum]NRN70695.1 EPTP domain-containing protein [Kibdelosporangium persicum]